MTRHTVTQRAGSPAENKPSRSTRHGRSTGHMPTPSIIEAAPGLCNQSQYRMVTRDLDDSRLSRGKHKEPALGTANSTKISHLVRVTFPMPRPSRKAKEKGSACDSLT